MERTDDRTGKLAALGRGAASLAEALRRRPAVLAALVIAFSVLLVLGRLLFGKRLLAADDIWTNDFINCNLPPRVFVGQQVRSGNLPLWMPGTFGGLPLIPQGEAAALNPFTWVLFGLWSWVTAANLSLVLHTALGGFGMVLLCRRFGLRLSAGLVAGLSFMFSGFLVEHAKHMNMHHASVWAPWLMLAVDWMLEAPRARAALILGAVAGLQVTEGHPQMSYVTLFALFPVALYRLVELKRWKSDPRYWRRLASASALAVGLFVVLSGAYLASAMELLGQSERSGHVNAWEFATHWEFRAEVLLTLAIANIFGDGANATYNPSHGLFWESWLYVGTVPCIAALLAAGVAVRRARSRRDAHFFRALFWLFLAGLGVALMLGKHSVIYAAAFRVVPGLSWFRFHHRFALVLTLAITALAALGVDWLVGFIEARRGEKWGRRVAVFLVLATLGDMAFIMTRHFNGTPGAERTPPMVAAIRAHAPAEPFRIFSAFAAETHAQSFRTAKGWGGNTRPFADQWTFLQPASNVIWGIESLSGYASLVPFDVAQVVGTQNVRGMLDSAATYSREAAPNCKRDPQQFGGTCANVTRCPAQTARAFGAYNVRFIVSPWALTGCPGWKLVESAKSGAYTAWLYENEQMMPRAYVVDGVVNAADTKAGVQALLQASFDPSREVARAGAPGKTVPKGKGPHQPCAYEARAPGSAVVRCNPSRRGFLVIGETRYPGREVKVDGKPTPTFAANGDLIGLEIDAGPHVVELDYRPRYWRLVPLSVLGWAALGIAALVALGQLAARRFANVQP